MTRADRETKRAKRLAEDAAILEMMKPEEAVAKLHAIWKRLHAVHKEAVGRYAQLKELVALAERDPEHHSIDLSCFPDWSLLLRETATWADDIRKEATKTQKTMERYACYRWLKETATDTDAPPIRGRLAVGTPNVRTLANTPHPTKEPEAFEALMRYLRCWSAAKKGCIKPYFPGMVEYITELEAAGKPLPPGLSGTFDEYRMSPLTRHRSVHLEDIDLSEPA